MVAHKLEGPQLEGQSLLLISIEPLRLSTTNDRSTWPRALLESIDLINSLLSESAEGNTERTKPISRIGTRLWLRDWMMQIANLLQLEFTLIDAVD